MVPEINAVQCHLKRPSLCHSSRFIVSVGLLATLEMMVPLSKELEVVGKVHNIIRNHNRITYTLRSNIKMQSFLSFDFF